ncbi:hypothetical protein [Methanoculleus frigidifontis]|uniref:hypothetical protein n=1 Tax=Methanoculleus frigidifontis TaxID=2584085 RepID=UPI0026599983|nr:hypothetical protein [Methanoculleus sp. FWC-SCC1]
MVLHSITHAWQQADGRQIPEGTIREEARSQISTAGIVPAAPHMPGTGRSCPVAED